MGQRDSYRRATAEGGDVVSPFGLQPIPAVLLPYEKQLAATIGLTEEEYFWFKTEVEKNSKPRPAAYDHIPDINNVSVGALVVSLVVGAVFSAASALLAPKPKGLNQQKDDERKSIKQSDLTGPTRYNSTFGFDSVAPVATWATLVPIPFGKYVNTGDTISGGIVVTPDLVWSRLFSYGRFQIAKLLYAGGEFGAAVPSSDSVYLGTLPLSKYLDTVFALYYRNSQGDNRIKAENLREGTRGSESSGDPQTTDDIFLCPTAEAEDDTGFCYTYSPSGDAAFGAYSTIANGTIQRVNWKVVSIPDEVKNAERPEAERAKICGEGNRRKGMPGVGRSFGRQMGLYAYKSPSGSWVEVTQRTEVAIDVGWRVKFLISAVKFDYEFEGGDAGVNSQDIQNSSANERARADDILRIGEVVGIGRFSFVVRSRSLQLWTTDAKSDQVIELEAIERFGSPFITFSPNRMLIDTKARYLAKIAEPGKNLNENTHIGLASTPLSEQAIAVIRATRETDVLEVGIKSQVWQQFTGLCNFQEVPSVSKLKNFDDDNVQIQNGTMNLYALRSSCFTVKVRRAGLDQSGNAYPWEALGHQFVIRGSSPVDQYNYLRFYFPFKNQKYEFRFEPLDGASVIREFSDTEIFEWLDAANGTPQSISGSNGYGTFVIKYTGHRVAKAVLINNPETSAEAKGYEVGSSNTEATQVSVVGFDTETYNTDHGKGHGWKSEVLGFPQLYPGQTRSRSISKTMDDGRTITIKVTATSIFGRVLASKPGFVPERYTNYVWGPPSFTVESSSTGWRVGDTFVKGYSITNDPSTGNNKFLAEAYFNGARTVLANLRVEAVGDPVVGGGSIQKTTRGFASATQLADVSYYPNLINHSNSSSPEHQIVYVNESVDNITAPTYFNMNMFGLALRSTGRITDLSQLRYWIPGGVMVQRAAPDAVFGEDDTPLFDVTGKTGRSNLFSDLIWYLLTNKDAGAGDSISEALLDAESFETASRFLARNKIFCDTVVQDAVNIRNYATELAPLMLCNFVIKDGKFAVIPAVPFDDNYGISLQPVNIAAQFTAGNIIEDSFEVEYLSSEDRAPFKVSATYRYGEERQLPEERNVFVRYAGQASGDLEGTVPLEQFPMAEWCTQMDQAVLIAKYMLALRKHITHTVSFKTTPEGLSLAPGDYIKVTTESNPFATSQIGTGDATGKLTTLAPIADGTYDVLVYRPGGNEVEALTVAVANGRSVELSNSVFSWGNTTNTSGVYLVEQLTIEEDSLVSVVASSFPCDNEGVSLINRDILELDNSTTWVVSS